MTAKSIIRRHAVTISLTNGHHEKLRCLGQSAWAERAIEAAWEALTANQRQSLERIERMHRANKIDPDQQNNR